MKSLNSSLNLIWIPSFAQYVLVIGIHTTERIMWLCTRNK